MPLQSSLLFAHPILIWTLIFIANAVTEASQSASFVKSVDAIHRRRDSASTLAVQSVDPRDVATSTDDSIGNAVVDLQCPPCDRVHCWPRRPSRLRCSGGVVRGVCNCCPVCARLEDQSCGGRWNYLGRCDAGLYCSSDDDGDDRSRTSNRAYVKDQSTVVHNKLKATNAVWKPEGRCRQGQQMSDGPQPAVQCFPPCTPEFCQKNVKKLCSANDNAERQQPCQADCQHTSCSACRFRRQSLDCSDTVRCRSPSDVDCLRRFGRCSRRQQCAARVYFPCRTMNDVKTDEPDMKFVCVVPECASVTE